MLWRSIKLGKELERLPHETLTEKQKCEIRMGQQAHERIISVNLRLVASLANKYQKVWGNSLDLWREGVASLERAIDKFNPSMGYGFSTYAYRLIHHCMVRLVINNRRSISKPFTIYDIVSKRNRRTSLGRRPICRQNLLEHATSKSLGSRDLCLSQPLNSPPVDLLENWIGPAPAHEDDLVQMAMERTQKLRDELLKDCNPASQVAKLLNIKKPALLLRQIRARNLLAIREKGEYVFPMCQFDSSAPQGVVSFPGADGGRARNDAAGLSPLTRCVRVA